MKAAPECRPPPARRYAPPLRATLLALERGVVRVEEAVIFAVLAVLVITLALQVASRFFFPVPLDWTEEFARVAQLWLVFLGAAAGARRAEHFAVEFLMERARFPGKAVVARMIDVLVVAFFCTLAGASAWNTIQGAGQVLPTLDVSIACSYAAIPLGSVLMAFHFAMSWLRPPEYLDRTSSVE